MEVLHLRPLHKTSDITAYRQDPIPHTHSSCHYLAVQCHLGWPENTQTGGEGNTPTLPCAEVLLQVVLFATSPIRIPEVAEQALKGTDMMLVLEQFPHSCQNSWL